MKTPQYVQGKDLAFNLHATIEVSSPFKQTGHAFNWLNRDYPVYHGHDHWELLVIMAGEVCHNFNEKKSNLKKGDACIVRSQDKHSLTFKKNYRGEYQSINFTFTNEFAEKFFSVYECYEELLSKTEPIQFSLDDSELNYVYERTLLIHNFPREEYEKSTRLIISRLLIKYFEQNMLFSSDYPAWLNDFLMYINNPDTFHQTVQELAGRTSYSYSRLARLFKQYTGETIVEYINTKKLGYAKRLLRTTNLTTLKISEAIGYSSLSSFNHLFKKEYGITPSEYRKKKIDG